MVSVMCGVQLKGRKRYMAFMLMLGLNETRSVGYGKQCWLVWSCVEESGWSCLEKGIRF